MANIRSAIKRARSSKTRTLRNLSHKSAMKTAIKRFEAALATGDSENINTAYKNAVRMIDKVTAKGILHPNARDRKKSQLARKVSQAGA